MQRDFIFLSESVTEGHPDKLCDGISDALVDRFLQQDPFSEIIAECAVSTAIVFIAARFAARASVDFPNVARQVIARVGYDRPDFDARTCSVITSLKEMPEERRMLLDEHTLSEPEMNMIAVRNSATVFGYACDQTPALMPLPIWLAHRLSRRLAQVRGEKIIPFISPDGSVQVGVEYSGRRPVRVHSIVIIVSPDAALAARELDVKALQSSLRAAVVDAVFENERIKPDRATRVFIHLDSELSTGGPAAHSGATGRKNPIDTYGQYSRQSGAALSGKGPTRIDRVGAYAARYAAKNIVAAGLAGECEVQLSYSIGFPGPVSVQVETFGSALVADEQISRAVHAHFDFRLAAILRDFNLRFLPSMTDGGFYSKLGAYGHVGRTDISLPWERTDRVAALRESLEAAPTVSV